MNNKLLTTNNCTISYDKRSNSKEFKEEEPPVELKQIKNILNDSKQEYDFKEYEIPEIEKLINSKIICNIGYGGFSTVKLIFNYQQKSYFALKVINLKNKKFKKKTMSKNKDFIYQEILVNFNAKNNTIVRLFGYFSYKDYILLIMEHMNNRDLKHFMKKYHTKIGENNFSEVLTGFFIIQILKSMNILKMKNILHRDIKPENIMLNTNYQAKLGDFSLSRKIDLDSVIKTSRSGTLPYLSPECVKKKIKIKSSLSEKIDVFSFGVVMYFLLFNRHPYNYKNHMNITDYIKIIDSTNLSFEGNEISSCCKDFLNGVLEKNIHKRFTLEQTKTHPWIVLIKEKIEYIVSRYQSDPDKMIDELNNEHVTDDYFNLKFYKQIEIINSDDNFINKKRKRCKSPK